MTIGSLTHFADLKGENLFWEDGDMWSRVIAERRLYNGKSQPISPKTCLSSHSQQGLADLPRDASIESCSSNLSTTSPCKKVTFQDDASESADANAIMWHLIPAQDPHHRKGKQIYSKHKNRSAARLQHGRR